MEESYNVKDGLPGRGRRLEPAIIHLATVSDILACIALHFARISESLPLLDLPLGALSNHIGTWGNVSANRAAPSLAN